MKNSSFFANLRSDLPASLVVFLVALPLCLGIALASGAPLFSGIIAGIVGGTVVALISGSPLGVSGPAAGLAVIVANSITDLGGDFNMFLMAVVIAGIFQLILGILKAGVIGYYFPSSVISGMLTGIGIVIILKQIPHAFGYDADPEGDLSFIQPDGHNTFSEIGYMLDNISPGVLIITAISMFILILWNRPFFKSKKLFSFLPGPLVAVASAIGLNLLFQKMGWFTLTTEQMVNIPVSEGVSAFFNEQFTLPDFSQLKNPVIYKMGAIIALVASLETLLCVEATDKLDPKKRITPTNRELIAQGTGNIVSGMIGGLPITQVIVRSSANIQSGGKSKASAFFHGLLLLVCAMAIPNILNLIPLGCLAAILLVVGYKLAKPDVILGMFKKGAIQWLPFAVTVLGIVFIDLLWGIGLGLAVGIIQLLWKNFQLPYHFDESKYKKGEPIKIELSEDVSFLNKASIMRTLNQLPNSSDVIIDLSKSKNIHPDVLEIIHDFETAAPEKDIKVTITGEVDDKLVNPVKVFDKNIGSSDI